MGKPSRDKGLRCEREIVRVLQDAGIAAERVPASGQHGGRFGGDVSCPILGHDKRLECKARANGFVELYKWIMLNYGLVLKADRKEPLVVLRLRDFAALAIAADKHRLRSETHAPYEVDA